MFSVSCTENSFALPSVITFCIFCGVLMQISSLNSKSILLRSSVDTTQILQEQLQLIELYVNVIDACSGISPIIWDMNGKHHRLLPFGVIIFIPQSL